MGTTPISALRYAELTDPANAKTLSQNLATDLDTLVNSRFASSTLRDAAIPTPTDGQRIYRTDIHGAEYYRTAAWRAEGGIVFAESTLVAPAASISFTAIPQNAQHLRIVLSGRCSVAGTSVTDVSVTFNSISTGYFNFLQEQNSTVSSGAAITSSWSNTTQTNMRFCLLPNSGNTANVTGQGYTEVPFYTRVGDHLFVGEAMTEGATAQIYRKMVGGNSGGTGNVAITRIDLTPASGNFDTGTTYGLYGIL